MSITDIKFTNNARTLLSTGSLADDATSVSVDDGSVFPALSSGNYFYATLERASDSTTREIVKVTARSGNNLTIVRAQDNTSATTFSADDIIELRVVAKAMEDIRDAIGTNSIATFKYTATAGQTTFSGNDDASNSLLYSVGNLIVVLNGTTLINGTDYTASNTTSVVLEDAATVGDELVIYAFAAFTASTQALTLFKYSATAGQTTFTGSDSASQTLAYTAGMIIVTLNGTVLDTSDYTASNGTSVVLASGASASDELNIIAFTAFNSASVTTASADFAIGDDLSFTSDGAIINMGADSDVTMTHVHNTGIKLNSTLHLEKSDATAYDATDSNGQVSVGPTVYLENPANANNTVGGQIVFGMRSTEVQARIGATGGTSPALVFGTADAERMRIDSNGHVLPAADSTYDLGANATRFRQAYIDEIDIGSNTGLAASATNAGFFGYAGAGAEYGIEIKTDASTGVALYFLHSTTTACGSISVGSSATAFNTSSDYRLKENVSDMSGAITRLKNLKPKRFNWISDENNELLDGFLAHEVDEVVPQAIHGEKDATKDGEPLYQGIDQSKLVPLLTGALQEAITKIESLEARIKTLEDA